MERGEKRIYSIAFDGMHRAGKGTQIEIFKRELQDSGIPSISIRGEGYRQGTGESPDDPSSDFWQDMSQKMKKGADLNLWDEASYRLARELIVWRDRILSRDVETALKPFGVLLIDRSLISKSILKNLQLKPPADKVFSSEELFPRLIQQKKKIDVDMVLPDLIFELVAPRDVLLSRLNKSDPDFEFRKSNIENKYELYLSAKDNLPQKIRDRIVTVDSTSSPEKLHEEIVKIIKERLPHFPYTKSDDK